MLVAAGAAQASVTLVDDGVAKGVIVCASEADRPAADELADAIKRVTGAVLPIVAPDGAEGPRVLIGGAAEHVFSDGEIAGLAAGNRFFAFDPETGRLLHDEEVSAYGALTGMQAPRTMAIGPDGGIYVLFRDAIARFEPGTFQHREIGRPGMPISAGIVIHESRLYFASGTRLLSYDLGPVH